MTEPKASRLERLLEKRKQIDNSIKQLESKEKEKQRKARVTRLIHLGALSEKYLDCANIEPADYEELLKRIIDIIGKSEQRQPKQSTMTEQMVNQQREDKAGQEE